MRTNLYTIGSNILGRLRAHLTDPDRLLGDEDLTRLCFITSYFEAIYRNGTFPRKRNFLTLVDAHTTIKGLTDAVPAYVIEDIDEQMNLAGKPFAPLRDLPAHQRVCGPTFTGSTDVKADADFITGGFLIDCKAVTRPRRLGREEVQQLAGYLLLDYDDHYGIDDIGFYLARQGSLVRWNVPDFHNALGARTTLPNLRTALRKHLRGPALSGRKG